MSSALNKNNSEKGVSSTSLDLIYSDQMVLLKFKFGRLNSVRLNLMILFQLKHMFYKNVLILMSALYCPGGLHFKLIYCDSVGKFLHPSQNIHKTKEPCLAITCRFLDYSLGIISLGLFFIEVVGHQVICVRFWLEKWGAIHSLNT